MKNILYKVSDKLKYTLCGTCDKGMEWEEDGSHTICYCNENSWFNLTTQFLKRKIRRKNNEPIFTDTKSTS